MIKVQKENLGQENLGDRKKAAMLKFQRLLAVFNICVTDEAFAEDADDASNIKIICRLQAPTAYDLSVRLAKAGWMYTGDTEGRTVLYHTGPDRERIQIIREANLVKLVYVPADADNPPLTSKHNIGVAGAQTGRLVAGHIKPGTYKHTGS